MKRAALLFALVVGFSGSAVAADYRIPMTKTPVFSWTGFYAGIQGGWIGLDAEGEKFNGGLFGGQLGYNWQMGTGVFGAEFDSVWTSIKESEDFFGIASAEYKANYEGSFRVRGGTAMDRTLLYVTGGVAWIRSDLEIEILGFTERQRNTHVGWTLGLGAEHAFTDRVTGRIEYRYSDYGSKDYFGEPARLKSNSVRLGLNYLFN